MKTKFLSIILCAAALFAACDTTDDLAPGGQKGTPLSITVAAVGFDGGGPDTRAAISGYTTAFETGDAIGIFASDGTTSYTNKKWERQSDGSWSPATAGDNIYYNGGTMTIKAYYPYNTGASAIPTAATFAVKADQSDFDTGYEASDLLLGNFNWGGQPAAQTLTFGHAMALLEVAAFANAGYEPQNVTVSALCTTGGTAETVTLYPVGSGVYRALLPAQTLAAGVVFNYSDTESYYYDLNGTTLTAGNYLRGDITVPLRGIRTATELVQFSADWNAATTDDARATVIKKWSYNGTATGDILLLADIDMSSAGNFTPIGSSSSNTFSATFDGCGYTISGLTVSGATNAGLFGYASGGSISRVSIKDCSISGTSSAGGIVGFISGNAVTGCSVSGSTTVSNFYAGGIVGYVGGNSSVTGCISATTSVSGYYTGVVAGFLYSGSITAVCYVNNAGGVTAAVGNNYGTTTNLMPFASSFGDFFTTTQSALSNQTPIQVMNNAISSSGWQWVAQGTGVLPKIVKK